MQRRSLVLLTLLLAAGCGGGGGKSDPVPTAVVTARPTLTDTGSPAIAVQWAQPAEILPQRIIEYQILRDDARIGVVDKTTRLFLDNTIGGSITYHEADGTNLNTKTGNRTGFSVGKPGRYQVRMVYQKVETTGATTYVEALLNTPGSTATALRRPTLAQVTAQGDEALVRYARLDGAGQYQVELSAFADFHTKIVRGPVSTTDDFGLVTIPWPTDSVAGSTVYARIGARSSKDTNLPVASVPNGDDFIYSATLTVTR